MATGFGISQFHLNCDQCEEHCDFHCNICGLKLCDSCKEKHSVDQVTSHHKVTQFSDQEIFKFLNEKCQLHTDENLCKLCSNCETFVCKKCTVKPFHKDHLFLDMRELYECYSETRRSEISKIREHLIPTSNNIVRNVGEDVTNIKDMFKNIRRGLKSKADSLKTFVDDVVSGEIDKLGKIEKDIIENLNNEEDTLTDFISYLTNLRQTYESKLLNTDKNDIIVSQRENTTIKTIPIPETHTPDTYEYEPRRATIEEVSKLFGSVRLKANGAKRIVDIDDKLTLDTKQKIPDKTKIKPEMVLRRSAAVKKLKEINVNGVHDGCHISFDIDRLWVSDTRCVIVQADLHGKLLQKINAAGGEGYHSTNKARDLLFADKERRVISKITIEKEVTEFISTEDWVPKCVFCSKITKDIFVGTVKETQGSKIKSKIKRYDNDGLMIREYNKNMTKKRLYEFPTYICENKNEDVCTSDHRKKAVVVVSKSGRHKFSYQGSSQRTFSPNGICTDDLGHLLICDGASNTVHIVDENGSFIALLINEEFGLKNPCGLCLDEENNLLVGQWDKKTISVFKYLDYCSQ